MKERAESIKLLSVSKSSRASLSQGISFREAISLSLKRWQPSQQRKILAEEASQEVISYKNQP